MQQFWTDWGDLIWTGTVQTLTMTSIALLISTLIGLPLGTLLVLTRPNGRLANRFVYGGLSSVINVIRSIPFIIL
ncbi:MAG: metal ABC transporter permease, partial [Exiguobacterium profundum]